MADPITLINLAFSGIKVAASIGTWMEKREIRKQQAATTIQPAFTASPTGEVEDMFLVLSVLGQQLLILDVIAIGPLPRAHTAVIQAFTAKDKSLLVVFEKLDQTLQYSVTTALFFCAVCWPMHIYRGFGTGVLHEPNFGRLGWGGPWFKTMDSTIAYLQSMASDVHVFRKTPTGLSRFQPDESDAEGETDAEEKAWEKLMKLYEEFLKAISKRGLPQPKDRSFRLGSWHILAYSWTSSYTWSPVQDHFRWALNYQADPGKFLHAYTIGRHLDLQDGEALFVLKGPTVPLLIWLQGLAGMTFKLVPASALDFSSLKLSSKAKKLFLAEEVIPYFAVKDPIASARVEAARRDEASRMEAADEEMRNLTLTATSGSSPPLQTVPIARRRPAPKPPAPPVYPSVRQVKAVHDFVGEEEGELSFVVGDLLDIIKEEEGDGWCEARLDGKRGIIPASFVVNV
ncbi:hypothetical protein VTL71DRAFT_2124 [Oculimacula yallundae]|uniref:SH3 domain-containing protein n=1 Tax=Oculimacula yallundae TaxID=86028 RepID=A0ABR4CA69_9HELO